MLERIVKLCSKVIGAKQNSLCVLYDDRIVTKVKSIVRDESHILTQYFELLPSGRRFRVPRSNTQRLKKTFIFKGIEAMNRRK